MSIRKAVFMPTTIFRWSLKFLAKTFIRGKKMKICAIVACEKCQRIKRFLEWKHFDDLNQIDRDIYAKMETEQKLKYLLTICPGCTPPSPAAVKISY